MRRLAPFLPIAGITIVLGGLWATPASALTCTTNNVAGNWNAPATWSGCGGGVPGPADDAVIANFNRTYTVTANATVASVTFTGGDQGTSLRINGGVLLTITGHAVINIPTNNRKRFDVRSNGQLSIGGNLTLNGSGGGEEARLQIRDGAASLVTVAGNIIVNNADAIVRFDGAGTLNIGGNFGNGGSLTRGTGTVVYNGAANQNVGNYLYYNVRINKTGGTANLTGNNTQVEQVLTLTQGNIVTGANTLVTQSDCNMPSVVRVNGHVVGNLQKAIPNDASTCTFEIGDPANYTPVVATFVNGTNGGDLTAATFTPDHPNLGTSLINPTLSVNRYWRLTNGGVGLPGAGFSATFNFVAGDVDAGANTAVFEGDRYVAPNWFMLTPGARTATSTQLTGITGFGDFAVGERPPGYNPNLGRFNAFDTITPAGSIRGFLRTKVAGGAFSFDIIHLSAQPPTPPTLQAMAGPPANRTVRVELMNGADNSGPLDANNCRATWTVIQTLAPNPVFPGGGSRMTVTFNQPNAWPDVRVRVSFPAAGPATQIGCSTDRFAIRPASLTAVSATDTDWLTAGTVRTLNNVSAAGGTTHKAGRPFTLRAAAQNAAFVTTTNYAGSPVAILSACAGTACTAAFGTLTLGAFAADPGPGASGSIRTNMADYSEVGSFALRLEDQTFANVDVFDSTTAQRYFTSANVNVGRFVPDHFALSAASITNRLGAGCAPASTFTYMGEPMGATFTLTAQNATNGTTSNYAGVLAKIDSTVIANFNFGAIDNAGAKTPLTARLAPISSAGSWVAGVAAAVSASVRLDKVANPDGVYTQFNVGIAPQDADGVLMGAYDLDVDNDATNEHANVGQTEVRFGRLDLMNAFGSELLSLAMPMRAQYYVDSNTGFVINAADGCTSIPIGTLSLANNIAPSPVVGPGPKTIGSANTTASITNAPLVAGDAGLSFSTPGVGGEGYVDVTVDLAARPWLQYDWDGDGVHNNNPVGRATFGIYKGRQQQIYQRERY